MASLGGRLERGAALARSGKVFKTEIKGNSVTSKVKGVSSPFYTVSCTWPRFQGEQKNVIVKLIQQNPQFLGEILRGNLPVDLIKAIQHLAAQSGGVALLPTSYHELNGQCNCPDNMGGGGGGYYGRSAKRSGDPCKHQAGLFYMIIKEVDNNPFTLFTLHGLDIIVSLGMQSVGQATTTLAYPFAITQYAHDSDAHTEPQSTTDTVALPKLCAATTFISRLLSPNPVFDSTCDFRDVLLRVYTLATAKGKGSKKLLAEPVWMAGLEQEDVDRLHAILSHSHIKVHVCAGLEPSKTFVSIDNELFKTDDKDASSGDYMNMLHPANLMRSQSISMGMPVVALDTLLALLLRFQAGHVGSPSYRYFWQCARLAFICVSSGCFLPIVIPTDTTGSGRCWSVRYRPLRCNTAVAETAAQLRQLYPVPTPARGSLKTQGVMFNTNYEMVDGKYILLAPEAGTEIALTMFISSLVYRLALPAIQPLHATFYKPQQYMALTLGDQSLGRSVVNWLSVFEIMDFEYNIELAIQPVPDRDDHDFSIYLSSKRGEKLSDLEESSQKSPPSKQGKWNYDSRENTANPHHIIQHSPMKAPVILKLLSALGEYIPNIGKLMKQSTTRIDYRQFENLALNSERILTMLGVKLTVPKGLLKVLTPKLVVVGTLEDDDDRAQVRVKGYLEIAALLQFKAMVAIGDKRITIDEFEKLLDTGHELVEFRDSFVAMNAREVQNLLKEAHSVQESVEERISPIELLKQQFGGLNRRGLNMFLGASEQELVDRMLRVTEVSVPQGLRATLRPYQERGLSWLASNADKVGGCVLADDMGLGKTVQIIAMLQHLKCTYELCHERPALIVAPSSLLTNWSRELAKFAPCLNVLLHHGDARDIFFRKTLKAHEYSKQNPDSEADCQSISEAGVHTRRPTYDSKVNILSNSAFVSTSDATEPARKKQRRSITRDTLKAIAEEVTKKKAADVILTSYGTLKVDAKMFAKLNMSLMVIDEAQTIKNHKSQISKLCKQVSKTAARRVAMTGTPVENRLSELHSIFDFALPAYLGTLKSFVEDYSKPIEIERNEEVLENLKRLTDPFLLRRLKTDPEICKELPPKVEQVQYASLSPKQGALYQAVTDDILAKIEEAKENGLPAPGLVFKLLIALKQICNHPDNYTSEESVKQETTESKILQDINTSGTPEVADSGKMQLLLELLRPILARGEKVLIFTQYVKMAYLLKNMIARTLYTRPLVYSGALSVDKRQQVLDKFDIDPANSILILSLKAGGVGLNLTQANHVIHYDRWFNPAVEAQASDRAFRIGQTKRVFVHHFVCQNTFEDKIHEMIQRKKELANLTVTAGEKWIGNLRHDELQDLFSLAPGKRVNDERGDDGQD